MSCDDAVVAQDDFDQNPFITLKPSEMNKYNLYLKLLPDLILK